METNRLQKKYAALALIALPLLASVGWRISAQPRAHRVAGVATVPGMPPVIDGNNLYSEIGTGHMSAAVAGALERVYVPNHSDNTVSVIDPETLKVVDTFRVGINPQHVVPAWDLRTLWVANNAEGRSDGSLTPIDPLTGKPGRSIPVDDPYNLYFSPDGKSAIVVAEEHRRLDFRDPVSMKLQYSIATPKCIGINHADFSIDGTYALFTCEFDGALTKIDLVNRKVVDTIRLSAYINRPDVLALLAKPGRKPPRIPDPDGLGGEICTTKGMPQDVRASPDGRLFFVADMMVAGVHVVEGDSFRQIGFIPTGVGAHGLYPSRDGTKLYVTNRGSDQVHQHAGRQRQRIGDRFRHPQGQSDLADPRGRQPGHGQCQRRRRQSMAFRALRQRGLPLRHALRQRREDQGGPRTAWLDGVAAAGPLFTGAHRKSALTRPRVSPDFICGGAIDVDST